MCKPAHWFLDLREMLASEKLAGVAVAPAVLSRESSRSPTVSWGAYRRWNQVTFWPLGPKHAARRTKLLQWDIERRIVSTPCLIKPTHAALKDPKESHRSLLRSNEARLTRQWLRSFGRDDERHLKNGLTNKRPLKLKTCQSIPWLHLFLNRRNTTFPPERVCFSRLS